MVLIATILEKIKTLLEVDLSEEIFDDQLLLYLNNGLRYLINNKIPLSLIDDTTTIEAWTEIIAGDDQVVLSWLHLYTIQRFDRSLMQTGGTTMEWIDKEQENLLYQLKVKYDQVISSEIH